MTTMLPAIPLLSAFLIASLVLAITPGPGVFYIVTRSLAQGRRAGLASVVGVALGNLGNAVGAAAGLAAVFSASALLFDLVRWLGAAYLVYLGVAALRRPAAAAPAMRSGNPHRPQSGTSTAELRVVRDGFLVALLNPKTALFFGAFLPQFIESDVAHPLQPVALGATFVAIAAITDSLYALFADAIAPRIARSRALLPVGRYLAGGAYVGLGLFTALSGIRGER